MTLRLPNFLIVGAMKAATSSLADLLGRHPDCFVAPEEIHFFNHDEKFRRGLEYYGSFFAEAGDARAIGEKTPTYSEQTRHPYIPQRIRETLGAIRLVWIFREPVARTVSHYRHALIAGATDESFDARIAHELDGDRCEGAPLVARSRYVEQVRLYLEHFPREAMHFCLFEDFVKSPAAVTARVAEFLGLAPHPECFATGEPRNRTSEKMAVSKRRAGWLGRWRFARTEELAESPSAAMKARLREHFAAPNAELARLTGLDLSTWKSAGGTPEHTSSLKS
jgi:hypothetical protein